MACGFTYCHIETLSRGTSAEEPHGLFNKIIFLFEKSNLLATWRKAEFLADVRAEKQMGKFPLIKYIIFPLLRYKCGSVIER